MYIGRIEIFIVVLFVTYLAALIGLICLKHIPRKWRIGAYCFFFIIHICALSVFHALHFIERNNASGMRAMDFFTHLSQQLSSGIVQVELLEPPAYFVGTTLSLLAAIAMIAGLVIIWQKIRWYSYVLLLLVFFLSNFLFCLFDTINERLDFEEHNSLRQRVYTLISQKKEQNITLQQIADAISVNMQDFHSTYENRVDEKHSCEKIISAINDLQPQE